MDGLNRQEEEQYLKSLQALCKARTAQLQQVVRENEQLLMLLKQLQSMESLEQVRDSIDAAIRKFTPEETPEETLPPMFGGKPGEPVPAVDPEDVKTVWQIVKARHPAQNVAVGVDVMKRACKPGADMEAVYYRASLLGMMTQTAPERLNRFTREGQPNDSVFRAAAKVPAEWMGVGIVRQGPPFGVNEFLQLCGEEIESV